MTEIEKNVRAKSAEHLKQLLDEDHRYIFTMIQKFRTEKGGTYPQISDRSDIIVIADEAHRSQYDTFALNMRNALPHAAFIGFTGTPLMLGEQETKKTFGDYISIYNFRQSIEDSATVPLYYENGIPELQLTNEKFKDPSHPLRIIFVCAMWMTGFDVPSCSTIYLDKPMKNHSLMQTIARANRVGSNAIL